MIWYIYIGIWKPESKISLAHTYPEYMEIHEEEINNLPPGTPLFRQRTLAKAFHQHQWNFPSKPNPIVPDRIVGEEL